MSLDLSTYPSGDFLPSHSRHWLPPAEQTLSSWMEANFTLSSEYSATTGLVELFGWQREIFDTFTDPTVSETVCMVSTQSVKTVLLQGASAYVIDRDPGPILLIQPNDDDAKTFSKERLTPMFRDNPSIRDKVYDSKGDGGSTLVGKLFDGGSLSLVGARTPGNLARRSIRYLFCDEVDKYPASAGKEGDPISLAQERLASYRSRKKSILCCSPSVESTSRIGKAYDSSDRRKPWAPCHACKQPHVLSWSNVKWDSTLTYEKQHLSAYYQCPHCRTRWNDVQRRNAAMHSTWIAEKPFAGRAGFWLSQLYVPWKKLSEMVEHFLRVKDSPLDYQVFVNTVLAQQWKDAGDMPDYEVLYARREKYPFGADAIIPARALFLTAFTDVQESPQRLETEVVAWGRNRENWSVDYQVTQVFDDSGAPIPVTDKRVWDKLDVDILQRTYLHESGKYLPIMAIGVDTGNKAKPVYEFARRHPQLSYSLSTGIRLHSIRTVVPTKGGVDALRILERVSKEDAARKRQGVRIVHIGTHAAKQEIFDALRGIKPLPDGHTLSGSPVANCYHHPAYEIDYFKGLTAEARVVDPKTKKIKYEKRRDRNEPVDTKVGNRAMAAIVGVDRFNEAQWREMEKALAVDPVTSGTYMNVATVVSSVQVSPGPSAPPQVGVRDVRQTSPAPTTAPPPPPSSPPAAVPRPAPPAPRPPVRRFSGFA